VGKLIFWVIIFLAGYIVIRVLSVGRARRQDPRFAPPRRPSARTKAEPMVRCAHCGVHLPRSDALLTNHHAWCSLEHAKLGPREQR